MGKSNLVDIDVHLHHETAKAVLISDDGNRDRAVWVPKENCEIVQKRGAIHLATMPEWVALEKGLI